jgi:hypothetical protein
MDIIRSISHKFWTARASGLRAKSESVSHFFEKCGEEWQEVRGEWLQLHGAKEADAL